MSAAAIVLRGRAGVNTVWSSAGSSDRLQALETVNVAVTSRRYCAVDYGFSP